MKAAAIAERELRKIVSSRRFRISVVLGTLFVVLSCNPRIVKGWSNPDIYLMMTFSYSIPILGFAVLLAFSDIVSGDWENGTIDVLLTQPVSDSNIMLGKFIGAACAACILSVVNVLLICISSLLLYGSMASLGAILLSLLTYELFFYAMLGLTIFFSTTARHAMSALVMTAFFYAFLVESYAIETMMNMKSADLMPAVLILFVGMWVVWPANLAYEPTSILKYIAPNVDAHRIVFSYFSPTAIAAQDVILSVVALLVIGTAGLMLSILIMRRS